MLKEGAQPQRVWEWVLPPGLEDRVTILLTAPHTWTEAAGKGKGVPCGTASGVIFDLVLDLGHFSYLEQDLLS